MAKEETIRTEAAGAPQRRVRMDTTHLKSAYCNFFSAQDSSNEVMLNFGFNQSLGATPEELQVQMLQQVILHPATARQVKDALVALFEKRDERQKRAPAPPGAASKLN